MLITVSSSTSTRLSDLIQAQYGDTISYQILGTKENTGYKVEIQNLGANDVYYEKNNDATVAGSIKISKATAGIGGFYAMTCTRLGEINLIADTADNNIRVVIS